MLETLTAGGTLLDCVLEEGKICFEEFRLELSFTFMTEDGDWLTALTVLLVLEDVEDVAKLLAVALTEFVKDTPKSDDVVSFPHPIAMHNNPAIKRIPTIFLAAVIEITILSQVTAMIPIFEIV